MGDLFANLLPEELSERVRLVAEIFDFRLAQFEVFVAGDTLLQASLMSHETAFYRNELERLKAMAGTSTRMFEEGKLLRLILRKTQVEIDQMMERLENMYSR